MKTIHMAGTSTLGEVWTKIAAEMEEATSSHKQAFYHGAQAFLSIYYRGQEIPDDRGRALANEVRDYQIEMARRDRIKPDDEDLLAFLRSMFGEVKIVRSPEELAAALAAEVASGERNEDGTCKDPECPFCPQLRAFRAARMGSQNG